MSKTSNYLALGDSYTIGEGVPLYESFPYQAVQMLRSNGKQVHGPEIIAKTGWTTSELASHLDHTVLNTGYDFVSLLIGVNNQYRGQSPEHYTLEFEELLLKSISLAGEHPERVFVLSIPDWGLTPFAASRNREKISEQIALFNSINRKISNAHHCVYIDITSGTPEREGEPTLFAGDGLHPSGIAYKRWASMLALKMNENYIK